MKAVPVPLGMMSEEPIEASNKDFRNFRQHHARKTSRKANLKDVFMRLYHRSDPLILKKIMKYRTIKRKNNKPDLPDELKYLIDETK